MNHIAAELQESAVPMPETVLNYLNSTFRRKANRSRHIPTKFSPIDQPAPIIPTTNLTDDADLIHLQLPDSDPNSLVCWVAILVCHSFHLRVPLRVSFELIKI